MIRIIGLLPIGKKNNDWKFYPVPNFIMTVLQHVSDDLDNLLESVTPDEWTLFAEGYATLLCVKFLTQKHVADHLNNDNNSALALLRRIAVKNQCRDIADSVLTRFETFQQTLSTSNWTELLVCVSPDRVTFNMLEKTKSFEVYFNCITKASEICARVNSFRDKLQSDFDVRVQNDFESKNSCNKNTYFVHIFPII
jgi:hypothetical protein